MFSRRGGSPAFKRSIEQIEIGNPIYIYPSPIRKPSTTGAADLVTKEPYTAFLNSIVVGFENPIPVLITKPNHALVLNGRAEQLIHLRFRSLQELNTPHLTFSDTGVPIPALKPLTFLRLRLEMHLNSKLEVPWVPGACDSSKRR